MTDMNKNYEQVFNEISDRFKNKADVDFIKEKFGELTFYYLNSLNNLSEIEKKQNKIEKEIRSIKRDINTIEDDIYIDKDEDDDLDLSEYDGDDCEFEITCPYCNYEFIADNSYKGKNEIKCPKCKKSIELDWNDDECFGDCNHCSNVCYSSENETDNEESKVSENKEEYKRESNKKQNKKKNDNEDDM